MKLSASPPIAYRLLSVLFILSEAGMHSVWNRAFVCVIRRHLVSLPSSGEALPVSPVSNRLPRESGFPSSVFFSD